MINNDVNDLVLKKHKLMRSFDKKEITIEQYENDLLELEKSIREQNVKLLTNVDKTLEKETEEIKMAKKVEVEKKAAIKKIDYKPQLAKVLGMKSIKDIKSAAIKLKELVPEFDEKVARTRVNDCLYFIRRKQGIWAEYDWNEEEFLLTKKK